MKKNYNAICTQLIRAVVKKENKKKVQVGHLDIIVQNAGQQKLVLNALQVAA